MYMYMYMYSICTIHFYTVPNAVMCVQYMYILYIVTFSEVHVYMYNTCSFFLLLNVQTTTIAELIARGVKEFYPDKFSLSPPE